MIAVIICHVYPLELNEDLQINAKMIVRIYFYLISMPPPVSGERYARFIVNVKHLPKVGNRNFFHKIDRLFDWVAINLLHSAHFFRTLTHFAYSEIVTKDIRPRRRRRKRRKLKEIQNIWFVWMLFVAVFFFFFVQNIV